MNERRWVAYPLRMAVFVVGCLIAGGLAPFMEEWYGWPGFLIATVTVCVFAVILRPIGREALS